MSMINREQIVHACSWVELNSCETTIDHWSTIRFCSSVGSRTRWTRVGSLTAEKQLKIETDDLIRYDRQTKDMFYVGRRSLTRKRFGVMINLEYIEKVTYDQSYRRHTQCRMCDLETNATCEMHVLDEFIVSFERLLSNLLSHDNHHAWNRHDLRDR
jgi:hypothetical protein